VTRIRHRSNRSYQSGDEDGIEGMESFTDDPEDSYRDERNARARMDGQPHSPDVQGSWGVVAKYINVFKLQNPDSRLSDAQIFERLSKSRHPGVREALALYDSSRRLPAPTQGRESIAKADAWHAIEEVAAVILSKSAPSMSKFKSRRRGYEAPAGPCETLSVSAVTGALWSTPTEQSLTGQAGCAVLLTAPSAAMSTIMWRGNLPTSAFLRTQISVVVRPRQRRPRRSRRVK
jgi:hypothetical protein